MHGVFKRAPIAFTPIALTIAFMALTPAVATAQDAAAASPLNGTWKLDPATSKFPSGRVMKSDTRTYEVNGDKIKMTATGTDGSDKPTKYSYSAAYDGKYYPMIGNPLADSIALKRIDARTTEATIKKGGAVAGSSRLEVSADGEHLAFTRKMMNGKAAPVADEISYVKQH